MSDIWSRAWCQTQTVPNFALKGKMTHHAMSFVLIPFSAQHCCKSRMWFRRWHIRREISFHQILFFFLHRARLAPITPVLSHYPAQAPTSDKKYKYFQSLQCQNVKRMHCSDDSKNIYCTHYGAPNNRSL